MDQDSTIISLAVSSLAGFLAWLFMTQVASKVGALTNVSTVMSLVGAGLVALVMHPRFRWWSRRQMRRDLPPSLSRSWHVSRIVIIGVLYMAAASVPLMNTFNVRSLVLFVAATVFSASVVVLASSLRYIEVVIDTFEAIVRLPRQQIQNDYIEVEGYDYFIGEDGVESIFVEPPKRGKDLFTGGKMIDVLESDLATLGARANVNVPYRAAHRGYYSVLLAIASTGLVCIASVVAIIAAYSFSLGLVVAVFLATLLEARLIADWRHYLIFRVDLLEVHL